MIVIGLGTNQGNKPVNIKTAIEKINEIAKVTKISKIYQTEPIGTKSKEYFLNAAVAVETNLTPAGLLKKLLAIEQSMGRFRKEKNDPRAIDLDILFYNDEIVDQEHLKVPHPRLHQRFFTLDPLKDLNPNLQHPILNKTVKEMLTALE